MLSQFNTISDQKSFTVSINGYATLLKRQEVQGAISEIRDFMIAVTKVGESSFRIRTIIVDKTAKTMLIYDFTDESRTWWKPGVAHILK